jgi:hypothetical protein
VVTALTGDRRVYVLGLASGALPLVFLSLRSLRTSAWPLLLGVPPLAVQLFSSEPRKWDLDYPYGVPVVAAFAAAAVLALRFLPANTTGSDPVHGRPPAARRLAVVGWLALVLVHLVSVVPSPFGPGRAIDTAFAGSVRASALDHAIGLVPADASISAQDDIVPHVAARSEVHRWPDGSDTDEYVLLDLDGAAANVKNRAALIVAGRQLRADTGFEVLLDQAGVIVARRRAR